MTERELTHVGALLENIQTSVKVIAEAQGASVERLERIESRFDRFETRFDSLEMRFDRLEMRFDSLETRVGGLEGFASDAQQRLKRIEGHLELNSSSHARPRRKVPRASLPKHRKKA